MAKQKQKTTIYTVAKAVGVSPAAVSLALSNQPGRVSAETAEKIRRTANRLGYVPNLAGRRLRTQSGVRQIDLAIATSFEAPLALVGEWVRYLHDSTRQWAADENAHVSIAIELFHAGKLEEMKPLLTSNRFNGLLVTNTYPADDAFLEATELTLPIVVIGRDLRRHFCVTEPHGVIGRRAAEIFHAAGLSRPAIMHGTSLTELTRSRMDAFSHRCAELWGHPPELIPCDDLSPETGEKTMHARLAAAPLPDGLFAVTDSLLQGAYRALHKANISIPETVSVIGIGDYETSSFYNPGLSTLADTHTAVNHAIQLLLRMIQLNLNQPESIVALPDPVFRGSVRNEGNLKID